MKTPEALLWILGTTLLTFYGGSRYWGEVQRGQALASFATLQEPAAFETPPALQEIDPDRVIAVLRIPGLELEIPVYHGTTEHVLRRGAGLVEGTAFPGSQGNVGIAAHRDTHFRALKDVAIGDLIELGTPERTLTYHITALEIVSPGDVHVLDETGEPVLTLVTCYPFHFVGNAPQRYIVRASLAIGYM
jgi:sortase A